MSYKPVHNYRQRDKLPPNDPNKIIYGSHLSDDFEAISRALGVIPNGGEAKCAAEWGKITGNISQQTDLQNALNTKLDKKELDVIRGGYYGLLPDKIGAND